MAHTTGKHGELSSHNYINDAGDTTFASSQEEELKRHKKRVSHFIN